MQKILSFVLLSLSILTTACSNLEFPGVYKLNIEQGNIVTQEQIDQLKPGMSREQVEFLLGSPLIKDTFNEQRWDYVYRLERGDGSEESKKLTIFFEGNALQSFSGDFQPPGSQSEPSSP